MIRFHLRLYRVSFALGFMAVAAFASAQTTVTVTGGEAGEGFSLDPAKVLFAYNVNGSAVTVQGVSFASLDMGYGPGIDNSDARDDPFPSGQNAPEDDDLRHVFQTIAWDGAGLHPLAYTFTGLTANTTYQLHVLHFAGFWNAREVAMVINGTPVGFYDISKTEAQDTAFTVTSDGSGEIAMLIAASAGYGGSGFQDGALVSAFALSTVTPVPEPATWAALAGAGALAFASCRRWRRGRA